MCAAVSCSWEDCGDGTLPVFWRLLHHLLQIQPWLSLFALLWRCLLGIWLRIVFQHHFYFLWFRCEQIKRRLTMSQFLLILLMVKMLAVKNRQNQLEEEKEILVYIAVETSFPLAASLVLPQHFIGTTVSLNLLSFHVFSYSVVDLFVCIISFSRCMIQLCRPKSTKNFHFWFICP